MANLKLFVFQFKCEDGPELVFAYTPEQATDLLIARGLRMDRCTLITELAIPTEPTYVDIDL